MAWNNKNIAKSIDLFNLTSCQLKERFIPTPYLCATRSNLIKLKSKILQPIEQLLLLLLEIFAVIRYPWPLTKNNNRRWPLNCLFHSFQTLYLHPFHVNQSKIYNCIIWKNVVDFVNLHLLSLYFLLSSLIICEYLWTSSVLHWYWNKTFAVFIARPNIVDMRYLSKAIQVYIFENHVVGSTVGLKNMKFSWSANYFSKNNSFQSNMRTHIQDSTSFFDKASHSPRIFALPKSTILNSSWYKSVIAIDDDINMVIDSWDEELLTWYRKWHSCLPVITFDFTIDQSRRYDWELQNDEDCLD